MMMVQLRFDDIVVVEIRFLLRLWRLCDYFAVILCWAEIWWYCGGRNCKLDSLVTAGSWGEGRVAQTQKCHRTFPNRSQIYTFLVLFQIIWREPKWKLRRRPSCSDSKVSKNISKPQPNIHSPCIISDNLTRTKMEAQEDGPGAGRVLLAKAKLNVSKNISIV